MSLQVGTYHTSRFLDPATDLYPALEAAPLLARSADVIPVFGAHGDGWECVRNQAIHDLLRRVLPADCQKEERCSYQLDHANHVFRSPHPGTPIARLMELIHAAVKEEVWSKNVADHSQRVEEECRRLFELPLARYEAEVATLLLRERP